MPALGCAASGIVVTARTRSMRVQHGDWPDAAVAADHVGAPRLQLRPVVLGTGAVEAVAVFIDRDLRHDRQLGIHVARRENRLMQLFQVSEGFKDQQVDTLFVQRGNLLAKGVAGFVERDLAQRLDAHAQRANRAGHKGFDDSSPPRAPDALRSG